MEPNMTIHKIKIVTTSTSQKDTGKEKGLKKRQKMEALVSTLRLLATDKHFKKGTVLIPDACEKYGFV
jgi:hypothetical protein